MTREKIDVIGALFRFITPLLIAVCGWFTIQYLSDISKKFDKIDNKFDFFLESYNKMDKRVDRLEFRADNLEYLVSTNPLNKSKK